MNKKFSSKIKYMLLFATVVLLVLSVVFPVLAVVLFSSNAVFGGSLSVDTVFTNENDVIFTKEEFDSNNSSISTSTFTFGETGDYFLSRQTVTNSTQTHLSYYYTLEVGEEDRENPLNSAILVSLNDSYIGTLASLIALDTDGYSQKIGYSYVFSGGGVASNDFKFALHTDASEGLFADKNLSVTINCVATTPNYVSTMFVGTESELVAAINDINHGSTGEIVLYSNITLSSELQIKKPCTIDLFGRRISGATLKYLSSGESVLKSTRTISQVACTVEIDNAGGYLSISDELSGLVNVTATNFDRVAATTTLFANLQKRLGAGLMSGESVPLGGGMLYALDGEKAFSLGLTYTDSTDSLQADSTRNSLNTFVTVNQLTYNFKIIGSGSEAETVIDNALAHIPNSVPIVDSNGVESITYLRVTYGLYLPTHISSVNAQIEWVSSNIEAMDNLGLVQPNIENHRVTMTAYIKLNNTVIVRQFTFEVYNQNNASRFASLLARLEPLYLTCVEPVSGSEFILPGIDATYNYIDGYSRVPNDGSDFDGKNPDHTNNKVFEGLGDFRIESLSYSVSGDYSYIAVNQMDSMSEAYVSLARATFSTYAQIEVHVKFENDETDYTGVVGVNISLGNNSTLMNEAFDFVQGQLNTVNILENILSTRETLGMKDEKGDFIMPSSYNDYFEIFYFIPTSDNGILSSPTDSTLFAGYNVITSTDGDNFVININAEKFPSTESVVTIGVLTKLLGNDDNQSLTASYLTFSVPAAIHIDSEGFENPSVFYSVKYQVYQQLTEKGLASNSGFTLSGNNLQVETGNYILLHDIRQETVNRLYFQNVTKDNYTSQSNSKVAELVELLTWASATRAYSYNGTDNNGREFVTDAELQVVRDYIVSNYGSSYSDDTTWNELIGKLTTKGAGYLIVDGKTLNNDIYHILTNFAHTETNVNAYFKWNEVLQWATDGQANYDNTGNQYPNSGIIGENLRKPDGTPYVRDALLTISDDELFILKRFWNNLSAADTSSNNQNRTRANQYFQEAWDRSCLIPSYINQDALNVLISEFNLFDHSSTYQERVVKGGSGINGENGINYLYVTSLDGVATGLSYFTYLNDLQIFGDIDTNLYSSDGTITAGSGGAYQDSFSYYPIFTTSTTVSNFFNRVSINNILIEKLIFRGCSFAAISPLSLDTISNLELLTYIDLFGNSGVSSLLPLLNLSERVAYLDAFWLNILYNEDYSNRVLATLNSAENTIYYMDSATGERREFTGIDGESEYEKLGYLNEIDRVSTDYLQLATKVSTTTKDDQIIWTQEDGNPILAVDNAVTLPVSRYTTYGDSTSLDALLDNVLSYKYIHFTSGSNLYYNNTRLSSNGIYGFNNGGELESVGAFTIASESLNLQPEYTGGTNPRNYYYIGTTTLSAGTHTYNSNYRVTYESDIEPYSVVTCTRNSSRNYTIYVRAANVYRLTLSNADLKYYFYTGTEQVTGKYSTSSYYTPYTLYELVPNEAGEGVLTPLYTMSSTTIPSGTGTTITSIYDAAKATTPMVDNKLNPTKELSNYHGNYYWYTNSAGITLSGYGKGKTAMTFTQDHVYRLFYDFENFHWYYEDTGLTCVNIVGISNMLATLYNMLDPNAYHYPIGQIFYYKYATNQDRNEMSYGSSRYYQLLQNESTGTYYHKRWGDAKFEIDEDSMRIYNDRLYVPNSSNKDDYAGTGGAYDIVLKSWIFTDGKFYSSSYTVTMNGSKD